MRLDLFLKTSRLVKRRTLAQELCGAGAIKMNGAGVKAAKDVKVGDRIEITRGEQQITVEVLAVPEGALRKNETSECYRVLSEQRVRDEWFE